MFGSRITILVGHFGSGKTEIAVNLALLTARERTPVALIDLDMVKPYFRSRSARTFLVKTGVTLVAPFGENFYADLPILLPEVRQLCRDPRHQVIIDAGGNDVGARVLGSLSDALAPAETALYAVLNFRRPLTPDARSAVSMVHDIEKTARLKVTGVVSTTHLLAETTPGIVCEGYALAVEAASQLRIPVMGVAVDEALAPALSAESFACPLMLLHRLIRPVFEEPPRPRKTGPLFAMN